MPVQLTDVVSITSVGLAFSALGVAIDSVMVPRLERFRDYLHGIAEETRSKAQSVLVPSIGSSVDEYLVKSKRDVDAMIDDLQAKRFFHELSCKLFLNGSIVRALLIAMVIEGVILVLSVATSASIPILPDAVKSILGYFPAECLPTQRQYACDGTHSWLALGSCLVVSYISVCMFQYVRLWKKEQETLLGFEQRLSAAAAAISIFHSFQQK